MLDQALVANGFNYDEESPSFARCVSRLRALDARAVIIYGYDAPPSKGRGHTHYWIHHGFHRAFSLLCARLGIALKWVDDDTVLSPKELEGALVLSNINTDRPDRLLYDAPGCRFLVHSHLAGAQAGRRYGRAVREGRALVYEVYRGLPDGCQWAEDATYPLHFLDQAHARALMLWGTDLLPHEARARGISTEAGTAARVRNLLFIGSIWEINYPEVEAMVAFCRDRGLIFEQRGGYIVPACAEALRKRYGEPGPLYTLNPQPVSLEEALVRTRSAYLAPAIQGKAQLGDPGRGSYVPCRLIKNMSYGALGISNNPSAVRLFGDTVVFDDDAVAALSKAAAALSEPAGSAMIEAGRKLAIERHGYLERIDFLLDALQRVGETRGSTKASRMSTLQDRLAWASAHGLRAARNAYRLLKP